MTAPFTPDERAAMRSIADAATPWPWDYYRPHHASGYHEITRGQETLACQVSGGDAEFIAAARAAVPRLLDALDTAEAEVARLRAATSPAWDEDTCASCTHEYVADMEKRAEEAEAKAERQRDRLRAREKQVRRLRAEVTRLHALVADLRAARPAPVWDEDTVSAEVDREALRRFVDSFCDDEAGEVEHVMSADGTSGFAFTGGNDAHAVLRKAASALWPGESRATVQAEAVQEVIDRDKHAETILEMAEQIKKEGGKDER